MREILITVKAYRFNGNTQEFPMLFHIAELDDINKAHEKVEEFMETLRQEGCWDKISKSVRRKRNVQNGLFNK